MKRPKVQLTVRQLRLLIESLESHEYWQLSDESYRNDGYVYGRGSDDAVAAAEIRQARRLAERLRVIANAAEGTRDRVRAAWAAGPPARTTTGSG